MKRSYEEPIMSVKTFMFENIVTISGYTSTDNSTPSGSVPDGATTQSIDWNSINSDDIQFVG